MIDVQEILNTINSPDVSEQQLQVCLQTLNNAITETNVTMRLYEEQLLKEEVDEESKKKIVDLIESKDLSTCKALSTDLTTSLLGKINILIEEYNALLANTTEPLPPEEVNLLNSIVGTLSTTPTEQNINLLLSNVNNAVQQNTSTLAVLKNNLDMVLQSNEALKAGIQQEVENVKGDNKIQAYKTILQQLDAQIQEDIKAFKEFQEQSQDILNS